LFASRLVPLFLFIFLFITSHHNPFLLFPVSRPNFVFRFILDHPNRVFFLSRHIQKRCILYTHIAIKLFVSSSTHTHTSRFRNLTSISLSNFRPLYYVARTFGVASQCRAGYNPFLHRVANFVSPSHCVQALSCIHDVTLDFLSPPHSVAPDILYPLRCVVPELCFYRSRRARTYRFVQCVSPRAFISYSTCHTRLFSFFPTSRQDFVSFSLLHVPNACHLFVMSGSNFWFPQHRVTCCAQSFDDPFRCVAF
jgi:hypothetical protein